MKNVLTIAIFSVLLLPSLVSADWVGPSPNQTVTTVAVAKDLRDDTHVMMEGKIEKQISGDKYLFSDDTGSIVVEIDKKEWRGVDVSPTDMVRLYGEVDTSWRRETEVDVDKVEKL